MPAPLTGLFTTGGGATAPRAYASNGHPLGSASQHNLTDGQYDVHYRLALALLGIAGFDFDESAHDTLVAAVALQIDYQISHSVVSHIVQSESRGARSVSYRERVPLVDPRALLLVNQLKGGRGYRTARTTRPIMRTDASGKLLESLGEQWLADATAGL